MAMRRPEHVDRLIPASVHYRPDGYHDDIRASDGRPGSERMPTEADFAEMQTGYARLSPGPARFSAFMANALRTPAPLARGGPGS